MFRVRRLFAIAPPTTSKGRHISRNAQTEQRVQFRFTYQWLSLASNYPVEVDMNWSHAGCTTIAFACLAACAGYENVDANVDAEAAPDAVPDALAQETDPEQYRISVEIPVDDVTIERGENLDVDALLDERTSFTASDFHLREVVLIARSRRGGSAELLVDEWASGAVDIPEGTAESWYEVRIPAADVGEAGVEWVVDFTGALDLNLLVAVLEPRTALLAAATATVREVVVEDSIPPEEPLAEPAAEVVQSVEVVEPVTATPTVVQEVAVVEQPVYRTQTVYRYVDRPVYRYRVSWIYDPARYYVFRDYGGWTYRYFVGTWDWRYYNPSFRLPIRHHHHDRHRHHDHDRHRHGADRQDGRRYERRDRDDRRGDRDRRRGDRDRNLRDRRDGNGVRPRGSESPAVVSRPSTLWRRVDPGHPRIQLATQRRAEPRVEEGRRTNPRLRASQGTQQPPTSIRATSRVEPADRTNPRLNPFQRRDSGVATSPSRTVAPPRRVEEANPSRPAASRSATDRNVGTRSFERLEARQVERRPTVTDTPRQPTPRPTPATRIDTFEPRQDRTNARTRTFQRRPEQRAPAATASPRTTLQQRPVARENEVRTREDVRRSNPRTRVFQREADRRSATPTTARSAQPRRTTESRQPARSTLDRQRATEREQGNARTRAFQRHAPPRVVAPQRHRAEPPRPPSRPRATPPRPASSPPARPQRVAPTRSAPPRERPVQRAPVKPQQNDSASDARSDEGRRSNSRTRAFERR